MKKEHAPSTSRASQPPRSWSAFDAELVILLVCSVILVVGLLHRRFDVPETLAMLGALGSAYVLARAVRRR